MTKNFSTYHIRPWAKFLDIKKFWILIPTLSGFEIENDVTLIIRYKLLSTLFPNIFYHRYFNEEHRKYDFCKNRFCKKCLVSMDTGLQPDKKFWVPIGTAYRPDKTPDLKSILKSKQ